MKLHQEPEAVQVATLFTVVGAEARKVFATFTDWARYTDQNKIQRVLQKFAAYCQPLKNVPFERYSLVQGVFGLVQGVLVLGLCFRVFVLETPQIVNMLFDPCQ